MRESSRFPAPWTAVELEEAFRIEDAIGFPIAYVYFCDNAERRASMAEWMSKAEARRIAIGMAALPELRAELRDHDTATASGRGWRRKQQTLGEMALADQGSCGRRASDRNARRSQSWKPVLACSGRRSRLGLLEPEVLNGSLAPPCARRAVGVWWLLGVSRVPRSPTVKHVYYWGRYQASQHAD